MHLNEIPQFTKNVLIQAIITHNQAILDIDKFEIQLPTKLHNKFGDGKEHIIFQGLLISIQTQAGG